MEPPSDLIDHFKLNACHTNGITTETSYSSDPARGFRKVKVDRKWHRGQNLGHGAFGAVWLEEYANATNEPKPKTARAVKEVSKPFMRHVHIDYNREILALAKLSRFPHEFVEFHGWFESDHLVFLVMEYVACGDLVGFIERGIGEGEARVIAGQLLEGLAVMHRFCFTHRDLKPSNIFVKSPPPHWWVKVGDFGITKRVSNEQTALRTEVGSRSFQAPEVAGIIGEYGDYSNSVDIWSLGCVIYKVLTGAVPFDGIMALESYCSSRTEFPEKALREKGVSDDGVEFLKRLLAVKPEGRPTAVVAAKDQWLYVVEEDVDNIDEIGVDNTSQASQEDVKEPESAPDDPAKNLERLGAQRPDQTSLVADPTSLLTHGIDITESPLTIVPLRRDPSPTPTLGATIQRLSDPEPPTLQLNPHQVPNRPARPVLAAETPIRQLSLLQDTYYAKILAECRDFTVDLPKDAETRVSEYQRLSQKIRDVLLPKLQQIDVGYDSVARDKKKRMEDECQEMLDLFKASEPFPNPSRVPSSELQDLISRYCDNPFSVAQRERERVLAWTGWPEHSGKGVRRAASTILTPDNPIQLVQKSARPTPSLERLISLYCENPFSVAQRERERVLAWTGWPDHSGKGVQRAVSTTLAPDNADQPMKKFALSPYSGYSGKGVQRAVSTTLAPDNADQPVKKFALSPYSGYSGKGVQRAVSTTLTPDNPVQLVKKSARPTPSLERLISLYCENPLFVTSHKRERVLAYTGWPEPQTGRIPNS